MTIDIKPGSRLEQIVKKLLKQQALINDSDKGSIEVNYSGKQETVAIKVVVI